MATTLAVIALTACGLLGAASTASAFQEGPELLPVSGSFPAKFNVSNSVTNVTMTLGKTTVTCTAKTGSPSLTGSGEFTDRNSGSMTLTFHNCASSGTPCKTPGQESGTVISEALPIELEERQEGKPGIYFGANKGTGMVAVFSCAWGLVKVEVKGGGAFGPVNETEVETVTSGFWIQLGTESTLESKVGSGGFEAANITSFAKMDFTGGKVEVARRSGLGLALEEATYAGSFSFSGGGGTLLKSDAGTFSCKGGSGGSGSFVSEDHAFLTLQLKECGGGGFTFTTPGQAKGTIATKLLRARPYYDAARSTIGLVFEPAEGAVFAEWESAGVTWVVTGDTILDISSPEIAVWSSTIDFSFSEAQQIEEEGPTYGLQLNINHLGPHGLTIESNDTISFTKGEVRPVLSE